MTTGKNARASFLIAVVFAFVFGVSYSTPAQATCAASQIFTARSCAGDAVSPLDQSLFQLVNKYRRVNNRPELRLSTSLSMLANRRVLDMTLNMKTLTHSWSNCAYDINDEKTWPCMFDSPQRLKTGYKGSGYETIYRTTAGQADPSFAMQTWQKSVLHNSIILNSGLFQKMAWDEVGVAVDGQFAVLWFGHPGSGMKGAGVVERGLGVSYDQVVAGLSKILSIKESSSAVEASKWQGFSADKKIKLEIFGSRQDISETMIAVSMKLDGGKLTPQAQTAISTLLGNLFPEWSDRDAWVAGWVAGLAANRSIPSRTKVIRKTLVELSLSGPGTLRLTVVPESKRKYVEVF